MAEGEGITAMEEGSARGEFSGGILHNFIVTLFTPKCNLCNLDYNLGAKPLNSLNLMIHYCTLLYIIVHYDTLSYTMIPYCTLLYTIILIHYDTL